MCGIAGFYNIPFWNESHLIKMNDAITHRGPDDGGVYLNQTHSVGLANRRLSILDLSSAGHQPMTYEDSETWIVYNGEVYNFIELRKQLETKGYRFRSESDTEVVLASYLEWGDDAFSKLNGMWAVAIYDAKKNRLLLCRDRYGIKPLYYFWDNNVLVFGSEYKVLWAVEKELGLKWDRRGIKTAIVNSFQLESSGYSLLDNVFNLLPGHLLRIDKQGCRKRQWWKTIDHIHEVPSSLEEQALTFFDLFEDSCRLRMRSDVPIGTSLSGGIDSSSVVVMLHRIASTRLDILNRFTKDWQKTFIHSFPDTSLDETTDAVIAADSVLANKIIVTAHPDDFKVLLDRIIYDFESIYPGMPDSPWRIYKTQRENGVIVTLDGHGCDEMLGGYGWYLNSAMQDQNIWNPQFWKLIVQHKQMYGENVPRYFYLKTLLDAQPWIISLKNRFKRTYQISISNRNMGSFFSEDATCIEPYPERLTTLPKEFGALDRVLYQDFHHLILPRILKNFDLVSMAHGVEVRMPFMDYRLVNFVFSLPPESKIGNGYTKLIVREAMKGILPDQLRLRKKKIGFNSPMLDLFQKEMQPWIEDCLMDNEGDLDLIDKKKLLRFYEQNVKTGKFQWGGALKFWQYLSALKLIRIMKNKPY